MSWLLQVLLPARSYHPSLCSRSSALLTLKVPFCLPHEIGRSRIRVIFDRIIERSNLALHFPEA